MTPELATKILGACVPYHGQEDFPEVHAPSADLGCVHPDRLREIGVTEDELRPYAGGIYCGMDWTADKQYVAVFHYSGLEAIISPIEAKQIISPCHDKVVS